MGEISPTATAITNTSYSYHSTETELSIRPETMVSRIKKKKKKGRIGVGERPRLSQKLISLISNRNILQHLSLKGNYNK